MHPCKDYLSLYVSAEMSIHNTVILISRPNTGQHGRVEAAGVDPARPSEQHPAASPPSPARQERESRAAVDTLARRDRQMLVRQAHGR